jgi:hypothetical protein
VGDSSKGKFFQFWKGEAGHDQENEAEPERFDDWFNLRARPGTTGYVLQLHVVAHPLYRISDSGSSLVPSGQIGFGPKDFSAIAPLHGSRMPKYG